MTERIPDQAARDQATDPAHSVLLRAPAGSGKTGVLLLRYLRCLLVVDQPEAVVAITFTRKAAAEVRERILHALNLTDGEELDGYEATLANLAAQVRARDAAQGWQLLQNPSRLRISTFDSFCAYLARRLPLLSGLGQIQTTDDPEALYREAIFNLFRRLEGGDKSLTKALGSVLDYASNRLEQLLPLLSNLLSKRDQWVEGVIAGDLDSMEQALHDHISSEYEDCCQQLQNLGVQGAIDILRKQSMYVETFAWAASCFDLVPADIEKLSGHVQLANMLLTKGNGRTLRKQVNKNDGFPPKEPGTEQMKVWLKNANDSSTLEKLTFELNRMAELPLPYLPAQSKALIADLALVLRHLLAELHLIFDSRGELDFPEVAFRAIRALQPLSETEGVYGDILLQEDRIQHVLVDEMQDTSVNQIRLLELLMQGWEPGDGRSLFLCGDLQQSIYLFRGALVGEFERLLELGHFNGHPLQSLQLVSNFRSAPLLVEWVNRVFTPVFTNSYAPAVPQRAEEGRVRAHPLVGEGLTAKQAEARQVAELVRQAQAEDPRGSIAILVRSRSHLSEIMPVLKEAGLRFAGQDIDKLANEPAVADFLFLLKAWWHRADRASWIGLLRAPFVGLSWKDCWAVASVAGRGLVSELVIDFPETAGAFAGELTLSEEGCKRLQRLSTVWAQIADHPRAVDIRWAVPALWYSLGGSSGVDEAEQRNIDKVLQVLAQHAEGGALRDLSEFERALDKLYAAPPAVPLEIMTIHKSKGLEFDTVILPGLGESKQGSDSTLFYWRRVAEQLLLAPRSPRGDDDETDRLYRYLQGLQRSDSDREIDRLLYVALTRARKNLHLLGAVKPKKGGERLPGSGSLLARLWPVLAAEYESAEELVSDEPDARLHVPVAPRISLDSQLEFRRQWSGAAEQETTIDRLAQQARQAVLEANIEERCVGLVYHELMRRLAVSAVVDADISALRPAIATRLRHHCHPETGLEASVEQVARLAKNTLDCESGRWILANYKESGAEQALRRELGDRWQKLVVDRFFVDGNDCWIIDYKTARGSGRDFFDAQKLRYQEKMAVYKKVIAEATGSTNVRAALYFPASQALIEC